MTKLVLMASAGLLIRICVQLLGAFRASSASTASVFLTMVACLWIVRQVKPVVAASAFMTEAGPRELEIPRRRRTDQA